MTRATAALAAALLLLPAAPGAARAQDHDVVVVVQPPGLAESALASCAGGAMIGALVVTASGAGSVASTAGLFCGLSVAASVVSTLTFWTWRTVTGAFH
jgi:hypothetical protein